MSYPKPAAVSLVHWTTALSEHPIFGELKDDCCAAEAQEDTYYSVDGRVPALVNLICESRGDLFIWSEAKSALLTTNLKRIKASLDPKPGSAAEHIDPVFQVRRWTKQMALMYFCSFVTDCSLVVVLARKYMIS